MKYFFILGLLVFPVIISTFNAGPTKCFAEAADPVDEEEDDGDDDGVDIDNEVAKDGQEVNAEETEDVEASRSGSEFASIVYLFIKPSIIPGTTLELPAGKIVELLIGFNNKGPKDLILETLDASLRYPMDFNYHIQNFSTLSYEKVVKPGHEATLAYSFIPADAFASRPVGLSINLRYRDASGNPFHEGVYNETINVVEVEEGLDGETFFLYVFLGACGVLLLVVGQQFLVSVGKKRVGTTTKKPVVETGTNNHDDVDYDWLPRETLQSLTKLDKSPRAQKYKQSQSPRQRKTRRTAGSDD